MKNHITSRDYELISAYLDNQLGSKERAQFEARLKADTELRKELQEISKTRLLVRSLPRLRAPRNYFIRAEAVPSRPTLKLAPVFGIVSALASVLFALVIFGSRFLSPSPQVAMAPAVSSPNDTIAAQQEAESSIASPVNTTEAPPVIMMAAPSFATPTPEIGTLKVSETEIATPTTIYLNAFPPTSTPEGELSIFSEETEIAGLSCEEYYRNGQPPAGAGSINCPTPTSTLPAYLESILQSSTPTPSETPTPTPTSTFTPTTTPTPTASPTPTPTETPPSAQKIAPPVGRGPSDEITPTDQLLGAGNPPASDQQTTEAPAASANISFLNYIVLTVEISLASIAIIAGITAIVLRLRTRR